MESDTPLIERLGLRPEVAAFAQLMESQLRANDYKPGWKADAPADLIKHLREEVTELWQAAVLGIAYIQGRGADDQFPRPTTIEEIGKEAADVANMAMMVADVCGALPAAKALQDARRQGREEAARVCREQAQIFLSPEYATGQPLSSMQERFACKQCEEAILALLPESDRP